MKRRVFKDFDVEKAKQGAKVLTRAGRDVRIVAYDIKSKYSPILAVISEDAVSEEVMQYNEDGEPDEADREELWLQIVEEEEVESEDEKMLNSIQECLQLFFKKYKYDKESISKEDIFKWIENKKKDLLRNEYNWWIARDKDSSVYIYSDKPDRDDDDETFESEYSIIGDCEDGLFPEVTWENSPKRVKVIISDKDEENN
jgi:hypothetical protein